MHSIQLMYCRLNPHYKQCQADYFYYETINYDNLLGYKKDVDWSDYWLLVYDEI